MNAGPLVPSVIVTGAASGIGRGVAKTLAVSGVKLGLIDINAAALSSLVSECNELGADAYACAADVADALAVAEAVESFVERAGYLTCVVCCAGIALTGDVLSLSMDTWQRTLDINLTGVFMTAKYTVGHLIKYPDSAFVAISSDSGIKGSQGYSAYCASKHGVIGLVRCMALDYGKHGLRSNVVCPGFVDTPMAARLFNGDDTVKKSYEDRIPLRRFAQVDDVANAVCHLLSPQASYANGMVYVLDGGTSVGTYGVLTSA